MLDLLAMRTVIAHISNYIRMSDQFGLEYFQISDAVQQLTSNFRRPY